MYIPILIDMRERKFYHFYPNAPKATRKAQTFGFQLQASWASFWGFVPMFCLIVISVAEFAILGKDALYQYDFLLWILLTFIGFLIFYPIRKRAWRILDEEARIEADMNRYVRADTVQAQFDELKKELNMKDSRHLGVFLSIIGLLFFLPAVHDLPFEVKDISTLSGSDLSNGTYYIDNLLVLDSYAKVEKGEYTYYAALFNDKDSRLWFISFVPPLRTKARKMIDEYMNDESAQSGLKLSVYVRLGSLSEEGKKYSGQFSYHPDTGITKMNLSDFYHSVCDKYSLLTDTGITEMNAAYICMSDENVMMSELSGSLFFILVLGLALTGGGAIIFIKSRI